MVDRAPKVSRRRRLKDDAEAVTARGRVMTIVDAIPPEDLVSAIKRAPSLRGMILGYIAELMFEKHVPKTYPVILSEHIEHHDDHDRTANKADRTISYRGNRYGVQLKSIQTNSIARCANGGMLIADVQNDASDRRTVILPDGSTVETTCYKRGDYHLLAVPLFPFTGIWEFAYKRNIDCRPTTSKKYTTEQAQHLLSTTEQITWPLADGWTTDLLALLD